MAGRASSIGVPKVRTMTMRCTGHCCRRFPLPQSLAVLRLRAAAQPDSMQDLPFIADMLIPLGEGTYGDGTPNYLYTCRHHNAETGDCKVYEMRPRMCSEYPYGKACTQADCTMENRGLPADLVQLRSCREDSIGEPPEAPRYVVADYSSTAPRLFPPIPMRQRDLVAEFQSEMASKRPK